MKRFLRIVLREPLFYFLGLGALIFAANAILNPAAGSDGHQIEVTKADVARIRALYAAQWGAEPRAGETPRLLDDYVRTEILYREGMALGLNTDDPVFRNRVVQKMEFLLQDPTAPPDPSDAEIAAFFAAHPDNYRLAETVTFEQLYFSPATRGDRAEADARVALGHLRAGPDPKADTAERGDPSMVSEGGTPLQRAEVERDFGQEFAERIFAAPQGDWEGPVRSAIGWHLVRVVERVPARQATLPEVRDRVRTEIMAERRQKAADQAFDAIRARYRVVVDPDALSEGSRSAAAPALP